MDVVDPNENLFVFIAAHSVLTYSDGENLDIVYIPQKIESLVKMNIAPPGECSIISFVPDSSIGILQERGIFEEELKKNLEQTISHNYIVIIEEVMIKYRENPNFIIDMNFIRELQGKIKDYYVKKVQKDAERHPVQLSSLPDAVRVDLFQHFEGLSIENNGMEGNIFFHMFPEREQMHLINKKFVFFSNEATPSTYWNAIVVKNSNGKTIYHNLLFDILKYKGESITHHNDSAITTGDILNFLAENSEVKNMFIFDSGCAELESSQDSPLIRTRLDHSIFEIPKKQGYGGSKLTVKKALSKIAKKYKKQRKSKKRARKSGLRKKSKKSKK